METHSGIHPDCMDSTGIGWYRVNSLWLRMIPVTMHLVDWHAERGYPAPSFHKILNPNLSSPPTARGLEGVIALESHICDIDGAAGSLVYRGYDIADLTANCSFEDVAWLLWTGDLPNAEESERLKGQLAAHRSIPPAVHEFLARVGEHAEPMSVLRTAVSMLPLFGHPMEQDDDPLTQSILLTARIPTLIAAFERRRAGLMPINPMPEGSTARNFLYMMAGTQPGDAAEHIFDTCLTLHAEHGLNASTFTARTVAATLTDLNSAITAAIGALKGPLHGGANTAVMQMLQELESKNLPPRDVILAKLERKERIMGFGHRVYRTTDPRAVILKNMLQTLAEEQGGSIWLDMSLQIVETMAESKKLYPNVDFFSASVYATLGIPADMFTPVFAMSRVSGWTAHVLEQWHDNRLIRPRAAYVGAEKRSVRGPR